MHNTTELWVQRVLIHLRPHLHSACHCPRLATTVALSLQLLSLGCCVIRTQRPGGFMPGVVLYIASYRCTTNAHWNIWSGYIPCGFFCVLHPVFPSFPRIHCPESPAFLGMSTLVKVYSIMDYLLLHCNMHSHILHTFTCPPCLLTSYRKFIFSTFIFEINFI